MCSEIFYNNEIKQSFINEKDSYKNKNFIEAWFKKSAPFEKELDKDLCCWDISDIISFYKYCNKSNVIRSKKMREAQIDEVKNVQKDDKVNEIKESKKVKQINKTKEKSFKILNFSIWRLLAYFIIYSVLGFVIETVFGMMTKGVIESRQSFLYGPFCGIYGMGAVVMILALQYFNQNNNRLFLGGFIVGSIVEYIVSLYGDIILHVKWWDYSNMPLNINGRICLYYSFFWGILAIFLMRVVHPRIEKFTRLLVNKLSLKRVITVTWIITIFIFI